HVGFKFHAVLVVNSAHLASLASPDSDRWLPIFWALDYFKSSQAATVKESGWRMAPVDEAKVPSAEKARDAFTRAMDEWDETAPGGTTPSWRPRSTPTGKTASRTTARPGSSSRRSATTRRMTPPATSCRC